MCKILTCHTLSKPFESSKPSAGVAREMLKRKKVRTTVMFGHRPRLNIVKRKNHTWDFSKICKLSHKYSRSALLVQVKEKKQGCTRCYQWEKYALIPTWTCSQNLAAPFSTEGSRLNIPSPWNVSDMITETTLICNKINKAMQWRSCLYWFNRKVNENSNKNIIVPHRRENHCKRKARVRR